MIILFPLFLLSFLLTFFFRKIAIKKSILDIPNNRSSHSIPTPRGGGLAIVISWFLGLSLLYSQGKVDKDLFLAFMSGTILVVISFIDDIFTISPKIRILFQIFSSILALHFLGGLEKIDLGFYVLENKLILTGLGFIGIVWFINLFNFLDGIDGYEASEVIFICFSFFILFGNELSLVLVVSCLGFLLWNWQPAKIFMGDVGSTLLGFNIVIFAIYFQNENITSILNILILSSVFWFDATITLIRRWKNREKLSKAHRKHAYQRAVQSGMSHQRVTIIALLINFLMFALVHVFDRLSVSTLVGLLACIISLFLIYLIVEKKKKFS